MRGLVSALILLVSCDPAGSNMEETPPNPCETEDRADLYAPGMEVSGTAETTVTLRSAVPAPPVKGDNTWEILVSDASGGPLSGLTIDVVPIMPDHGHGTPVSTLVEPGDDPGSYILDPVNLMMSGYWETTLLLSDADGDEFDSVVFRFCVEE